MATIETIAVGDIIGITTEYTMNPKHGDYEERFQGIRILANGDEAIEEIYLNFNALRGLYVVIDEFRKQGLLK